jgi:ABC-type phosphate transport system permease subunit
VRFAADTLNGVPSIVIGVFVAGIAVLPVKHYSALPAPSHSAS